MKNFFAIKQILQQHPKVLNVLIRVAFIIFAALLIGKLQKSSSGEYALARADFEHVFNEYSLEFCGLTVNIILPKEKNSPLERIFNTLWHFLASQPKKSTSE